MVRAARPTDQLEPPSSEGSLPREPSVAEGRVLHAAWGFGAATETFLVDRMIELDRLGWEAWVAAKWLLPEPIFDFPPADRVLVPRLRDRVAGRLRRGRRGREWWWLARPVEVVEPALIHAHFGWTARDAIGAAKHFGVPLVAGFHGYDTTVYPHHGFDAEGRSGTAKQSAEPVYAELFETASAILATSRFIASQLRRLGCKREVEVVPSGIRLECFPYRGPRTSGPQEEYRLLFVGRLIPYKGLDVAIRAVAHLAQGGPGAPTLVVIGEGGAGPEYEGLVGSLGVAERVEFRGRQTRSGVLAALRESDVVVVPSRSTAAGQAEGLGNVVKEALAVGLEVAVSDNGGLPEVVPPERRREMVVEGDPIALAERLDAIRAIRGQWEERAREGRRWVEETYAWQKLAPRIADVYRRVAGAR